MGSDYQSLLGQICQIFGYSKDSVVIKYADDEGDLVTVSSDEEVKFAIQVAKGVMRLRVDKKCPAISPAPVPRVVEKAQDEFVDEDEDETSSSDDQPKWKNKKTMNPEKIRHVLQRLTYKRDKMQQKLAALDSAAVESGKEVGKQQWHKEKLRRKISFLSARIDRLSALPRHGPGCPAPAAVAPSPFALGPPVPISSAPCPMLASGCPVPSAPLPDPFSSAPLPSKAEVLARLDSLQATIASLRLALRQTCLQLQLQRTQLQRARGNEAAGTAGGPPVSESQMQEMRAAMATAKANHAAAKAEVRSKVQEMEVYCRQLKAIKHQEKAESKAYKHQCKAARKEAKAAGPEVTLVAEPGFM